jgi:probable HAF family extracellular repeat protein
MAEVTMQLSRSGAQKIVSLAMLAAGAGAALAQNAPGRYTSRFGIIDLGTLVGAPGCAANAVNDSYQVVGSAGGDGWIGVPTIRYRTPRTNLLAINRWGTYAGYWNTRSGRRAIYSPQTIGANPHASVRDLNSDTYNCRETLEAVWAINDRGEMAVSGDSTAAAQHFFFWSDGRATDVGSLGGRRTAGFGIDNAGEVVGWSTTATGKTHAYFWKDGTMTDLGALLPEWGASIARGVAIAPAGERIVVGQTPVGSGYTPRASVWTRDLAGKWSYTSLRIYGDYFSTANGVNSSSEIVGVTYLSTGSNPAISTAFIHDPRFGARTLLSLVTSGDSSYGHWQSLTYASAITESGVVVGDGVRKDGARHAFLLYPISRN